MSNGVLKYVRLEPDQDPFELLENNGDPVWPIVSDRMMTILTKSIDAFGLRAVQVSAAPSRISLLRDSYVLAVGKRYYSAGLLYAHLTRRKFRFINKWSHNADLDLIKVIVAAPEVLTVDFFDKIYLHNRGRQGIGLVVDDPEFILDQVIIRSAATKASMAPSRTRIDVYPDLSIPASYRQMGLIGSLGNVSDIVEAVTLKAGVLTVSSHSDGIDAQIGQLILCPMDKPYRGAPPSTPPPCIEASRCHRLGISVADAQSSDRIVRPEMFVATILVWIVCWGIRPRPSLIDPRSGYIFRMLRSPTLGCIVTAWDVVITRSMEASSLSADLASGISVGDSVCRQNLADWTGRRQLCVFGDPDTKISGGEPAAEYRVAENRSFYERADDGAQYSKFYRSIIERDLREDDARAHEVEESLRKFSEGARPDQLDTVQSALICYLLKRGHYICNDWMREAEFKEEPGTRTNCMFCGLRTVSLVATVPSLLDQKREVTACPKCGVVLDAPTSGNLPGLNISSTGLVTCRIPTGPNRKAGILFAPLEKKAYTGMLLPLNERGVSGEMAIETPAYTRFICLFYINALDLFILRRPVYPGESLTDLLIYRSECAET